MTNLNTYYNMWTCTYVMRKHITLTKRKQKYSNKPVSVMESMSMLLMRQHHALSFINHSSSSLSCFIARTVAAFDAPVLGIALWRWHWCVFLSVTTEVCVVFWRNVKYVWPHTRSVTYFILRRQMFFGFIKTNQFHNFDTEIYVKTICMLYMFSGWTRDARVTSRDSDTKDKMLKFDVTFT